MVFVFGSYTFVINERIQTQKITYEPCGCQEKYPLRQESKLIEKLKAAIPYLELDSEKRYSVKYLVVIILAYCKEKGLFDSTWPCPQIKLDRLLKEAICPLVPYHTIFIGQLRWMLERIHFVMPERKRMNPHSMPSFICYKGIEQLLADLLGPSWYYDETLLFQNHC